MAARVIVYKSRMTKTMRRTKILCPPLFLFLEENDKSEPVANRHYEVRIIIIWYTKCREQHWLFAALAIIAQEENRRFAPRAVLIL